MQKQEHAGGERLFRGNAGRTFLVMSVGWIGAQIGRQLLPPLLPTIMEGLEVSSFLAGVALTALWATYSLTHYPGGRLADQLSRKTVLMAGATTLAVGFTALYASFTYAVFVISLLIIGVGAGLFFIAMRATTADSFDAKRSLAFGVQMSFGNLGSGAAAGVAVLVLTYATWQSAFLPIAAFFVLVALALHREHQERYIFERIDIGFTGTAKRIFGVAIVRRILLGYVLLIFTWQGTIGFLPTGRV
jgi:MFS family permease